MSPPAIAIWRAALDAAIVGQEQAKTGLLLAWIAREHAYLEGPPGCGKSALTAALAQATGARTVVVGLHRDSRAAELAGDLRLSREPLPGGGLRLREQRLPGELAGAELCVLDDLAAAPREALPPLVTWLERREWLGRPSALLTLVATAVPRADEPTPLAALDRFAVQVRMQGLLGAGALDAARALALRAAQGRPASPGSADGRALQVRAAGLAVPEAVRELLLARIDRLRQVAPAGALSDRRFAALALRLVRAHAVLRGADAVEPRDLAALACMTGARLAGLPDAELDALLEAPREESAGFGMPVAGSGPQPGVGGGAVPHAVPGADLPVEPRELARAAAAVLQPVADVEIERLLRAFEGRLERGTASLREHAGGAPRAWRPLRDLGELVEADPADALAYLDGHLPEPPRVPRRERREAGGRFALLRDVSASMQGRLGVWCGEAVAALVRAAARRGMRVGYAEFNHAVEPFSHAGLFFHRAHAALLARVAQRRAEGRTDYQAPLRFALDALGPRAGSADHVVLLTDGLPVLGDPEVRRERARARRLGVAVHAIFAGTATCPRVLRDLAHETGGLCLQVRPRPGGAYALAPAGGR